MRRRGFTLFELVLVMTIIAVMSGMLVGTFQLVDRTRRVRALEQVQVLADIVLGSGAGENGFYQDTGRLPADLGGELTAGAAYAGATNVRGIRVGWHGPYAGAPGVPIATDPWGHAIHLDAQGRVVCDGDDGVDGTADDLIAPAVGPLAGGTSGALSVVVLSVDGRALDSASAQVFVTGANPDSIPPGALRTLPAAWDAATGSFQLAGCTPSQHDIEVRGLAATPFEGLRAFGAVTVRAGVSAATEVRLNRWVP